MFLLTRNADHIRYDKRDEERGYNLRPTELSVQMLSPVNFPLAPALICVALRTFILMLMLEIFSRYS
jgi:hypothetical protein